MKKISYWLLFILMTAGMAGMTFLILKKSTSKPNNQYEVLLDQKYYILKDGNRVVDTISFGVIPRLDSILLKDNQ